VTLAVLIGGFLLLFVLGAPVSLAIGVPSLAALLVGGHSMQELPRYLMSGTDSFILLAIPFFILAGNLFNVSGATRRLFAFSEAVIGRLPGGQGQVTILANVVFSGMSGAALADIAGLGTIVSRAMRDAGYRPSFAAATILAGSILGPMIPPSIMFIIYAAATNTSAGRLFLAGAAAGLIIAVLLMLFIGWLALSGREPCPPAARYRVAEVARRTLRAVPALAAPVLILGAMRTGAVTATEAGMLATTYAAFLGLPYRGFTPARLAWAVSDSVVTTANIMWLIAVSTVMGHVLTIEGVAQGLGSWMAGLTESRFVVLLLINSGLLVLGCILETTPALLITSPILMPIAARYGVDPVHFGVVICLNLIIGIITPPMGIGLFAVSAVTKLPVETVTRAALPYLAPLLLALIVVTYVPGLVMWLPDLVMGPATSRR
jgi:tripartite ATP-independent transporter DctM subunit